MSRDADGGFRPQSAVCRVARYAALYAAAAILIACLIKYANPSMTWHQAGAFVIMLSVACAVFRLTIDGGTYDDRNAE